VADDLDPAAVERAARAGYDASRDAAETEPWGDLPEWGRETFRAFTRAALAATGLLVTPEHDAKVAARAVTEVVARFRRFADDEVSPLRPAQWRYVADVVQEIDRLERQEGWR